MNIHIIICIQFRNIQSAFSLHRLRTIFPLHIVKTRPFELHMRHFPINFFIKMILVKFTCMCQHIFWRLVIDCRENVQYLHWKEFNVIAVDIFWYKKVFEISEKKILFKSKQKFWQVPTKKFNHHHLLCNFNWTLLLRLYYLVFHYLLI